MDPKGQMIEENWYLDFLCVFKTTGAIWFSESHLSGLQQVWFIFGCAFQQVYWCENEWSLK